MKFYYSKDRVAVIEDNCGNFSLKRLKTGKKIHLNDGFETHEFIKNLPIWYKRREASIIDGIITIPYGIVEHYFPE